MFEKWVSRCDGFAQLKGWLNSMLNWKFQEAPRLKISPDLRESVTEALELMLGRCMDEFPDVDVPSAACHARVASHE